MKFIMSQVDLTYLKGINIKNNLDKNCQIYLYLEDFKFNMDLQIIFVFLLKTIELNFIIISLD